MKEAVSFDYINDLTLGDPVLTRDLLTVFVTQNEQNVQVIRQRLEAQDWSGLQRVAHKIKSSLALVGMTANRALAEELEKTAGQDAEQTRHLAEQIISGTHSAIEEIKRKLKKL